MAKQKRRLMTFEVSVEEEKMIEHRAKQEGVNRSQYMRECLMLELFISGDFEAYKFLGRRAGVMVKAMLADKLKRFDTERLGAA